MSSLVSPLPVRTLFRAQNSDKKEHSPMRLGHSRHLQTCTAHVPTYSRKEKSLGELGRRFLFLCGTLHNAEINLQQVALDLDVERRRIYDIINILQAFNVVERLGKNTYLWKGLQELIFFIANLDLKYGLIEQITGLLPLLQTAQHTYEALFEADDQRASTELTASINSEQKALLQVSKKKSLCFLSDKFVKLFYTWKTTISLDEAASLFMNETYASAQTQSQDSLSFEEYENLRKTKVRRLYDIANILQAVRLISKTVDRNNRPAFRWIGLSGLLSFSEELYSALALMEPEEVISESEDSTGSSNKICISLNTQSILVPRKSEDSLKETTPHTDEEQDSSAGMFNNLSQDLLEQILRMNALNAKAIGLKPVFHITNISESPLLDEVRSLMKQQQFKEANRLLKVWGHYKRSNEPRIIKKTPPSEPTPCITRELSFSTAATCSSPSERQYREANSNSTILRPVPIRMGNRESQNMAKCWGMEVKFSPNSAFVTPNAKTSTDTAFSSEKEIFSGALRSGVKTLNFDESLVDDLKL